MTKNLHTWKEQWWIRQQLSSGKIKNFSYAICFTWLQNGGEKSSYQIKLVKSLCKKVIMYYIAKDWWLANFYSITKMLSNFCTANNWSTENSNEQTKIHC